MSKRARNTTSNPTLAVSLVFKYEDPDEYDIRKKIFIKHISGHVNPNTQAIESWTFEDALKEVVEEMNTWVTKAELGEAELCISTKLKIGSSTTTGEAEDVWSTKSVMDTIIDTMEMVTVPKGSRMGRLYVILDGR